MALRRRKDERSHELFAGFSDVQEIGVGSLATVYRAREIGTSRLVALKLLNVRDASPRAIESFERESLGARCAELAPQHRHALPHVPDAGRAPGARPRTVFRRRRRPAARRRRACRCQDAVAIGIKVAGALETAHRGGILHRDVKPQNILVTEFGEPALADFGVAMLQSSTQTTAGLFDFTTLHAAPELLEGQGTSAATDVYELASSLYQLIAGQSAFRAYEGEAPASVILRILRDPVRPLSARGRAGAAVGPADPGDGQGQGEPPADRCRVRRRARRGREVAGLAAHAVPDPGGGRGRAGLDGHAAARTTCPAACRRRSAPCRRRSPRCRCRSPRSRRRATRAGLRRLPLLLLRQFRLHRRLARRRPAAGRRRHRQRHRRPSRTRPPARPLPDRQHVEPPAAPSSRSSSVAEPTAEPFVEPVVEPAAARGRGRVAARVPARARRSPDDRGGATTGRGARSGRGERSRRRAARGRRATPAAGAGGPSGAGVGAGAEPEHVTEEPAEPPAEVEPIAAADDPPPVPSGPPPLQGPPRLQGPPPSWPRAEPLPLPPTLDTPPPLDEPESRWEPSAPAVVSWWAPLRSGEASADEYPIAPEHAADHADPAGYPNPAYPPQSGAAGLGEPDQPRPGPVHGRPRHRSFVAATETHRPRRHRAADRRRRAPDAAQRPAQGAAALVAGAALRAALPDPDGPGVLRRDHADRRGRASRYPARARRAAQPARAARGVPAPRAGTGRQPLTEPARGMPADAGLRTGPTTKTASRAEGQPYRRRRPW